MGQSENQSVEVDKKSIMLPHAREGNAPLVETSQSQLPTQKEAINKRLHESAERQVQLYGADFATTILLQAKLIAHQQKAEVVLGTHVDEAIVALR